MRRPEEQVHEYSVTQLCLSLLNPMNRGLPGFSVYEILQARILERVVISSSRGFFMTGKIEPVSLASSGRFFTPEPPGKPTSYIVGS